MKNRFVYIGRTKQCILERLLLLLNISGYSREKLASFASISYSRDFKTKRQ